MNIYLFIIAGFLRRFILCFAFGSNARTILNVEAAEESLTCVHGIRFFSLLWTIMVHTYLQLFAVGENKVRTSFHFTHKLIYNFSFIFQKFGRIIAERTFIYQIVGNATFSVDSFFFISGLLVVLLFLKSESKKKEKQCDGENLNRNSNNPKRSGFICESFTKSTKLLFYRFARLTPVYLFIIVFTELSMK